MLRGELETARGQLGVTRAGVTAQAQSAAVEHVESAGRPVPDVLAYLQNETELTRSTLVRILRECGRLDELFANPQRFMDDVSRYTPITVTPLANSVLLN